MADPLFRAWDVFLVRAPVATESIKTTGDLEEMLCEAAHDALLMEAIALASPSLSAVLSRVAAEGAGFLTERRLRRAALSVLRYSIRMASRPTPFGLFAGVSCGEFDESAKWRQGSAHRTRTHADMEWLLSIVHRLEADHELVESLPLLAHQALTVRGDRLTLDCPSTLGLPPGGPTRAAVSVRYTPVVREIVAAAASPLPAGDLAKLIASRFGRAPAQVLPLIVTLVQQEVLITALRPPLDGGDPLAHVIGVLSGAARMSPASGEVLAGLRSFDARRAEYDAKAPGSGLAELGQLVKAARDVHVHDTPLHVDTRLDLDVRLPQVVRTEVERLAEALWRLSSPRLGMRSLRRYHEAFLERYGADRLVPLLELLDDMRSLGAPGGYMWPASEAADGAPEEPRSDRRDRLLSRLVGTAVRRGEREVVLDDALLAELAYDEADPADLPNSCELYVHVVAPSADDLTAGNFRIVMSPSPGSHHAGATFARFGDLLDRFAGAEHERPVHVTDAIPADLAFIPRSGRAANLGHTVPHSGNRISVGLYPASHARELRPADIAVGATLERMFVVHLPTGRELAPVLPNMMSPMAQAPNPARLLHELGLEGQRLWEPWNWGPMAHSPFLPRVRYGRAVLASATWRLDAIREAADWPAAVHRWRAEWDVPQKIMVVSADHRLLLDLTDPTHLDLLRDEMGKDPALVAQEAPGEGTALAEIVVPLARRDPTPRRRAHVASLRTERPARAVGGEWLYLKLRTPRRAHDEFVRDRLPVLVEAAFDHGATRWFFIRYSDDQGPHLRLRLRGAPEDVWSPMVRTLGGQLDRWQHEGLLTGHEIGEYDPELERYGGPEAREAAELLFQEDSRAVIALLKLARSGALPYPDDELAVISLASLAHAFGPPSPDGPWAPRIQDGDHAATWLSITGSRLDLPGGYRTDAARWRRLIDPTGGWPGLRGEGATVLELLRARDEAASALADRIRAVPATPATRVIGSLFHMTCNRLGASAARELELLGIARGAVQDNLARRRHTR